jgi:hypothetical protein
MRTRWYKLCRDPRQMGHTNSAMTARYTEEIPLEKIRTEFSSKIGNKIHVLENTENEVAANS